MENIRTLVVDDNVTDRMIVRGILGQIGVKEIQEAENGQIARFKIDNAFQIGKPFDLILLDWRMPSADGIEVLKDIRGDRQIRNTVVLLMTVTAEPRVVREAAELGVNDILVKPFNLTTVKEKISNQFKT